MRGAAVQIAPSRYPMQAGYHFGGREHRIGPMGSRFTAGALELVRGSACY